MGAAEKREGRAPSWVALEGQIRSVDSVLSPAKLHSRAGGKRGLCRYMAALIFLNIFIGV